MKNKYKEIINVKNIFDNLDDNLLNRLKCNIKMDINNEKIENKLNGKNVLVTGGGGFIGSELCRQLTNYNINDIIIFDIYENNAYMLFQELLLKKKENNANYNIKVIIGSVYDYKSIEYVFENYKIDIIFHVAANKHVPLMEDSPRQAILTNCLGTKNVVELANKYNSEDFLLVSSDKAIDPISVMGASKRLAEIITLSEKENTKTRYNVVRFGNVFNSSGSVIPIFINQILNNSSITITDKDATRYFMNKKDAVSLMINAITFNESNNIYMLDMKKQVNIVTVAEELINYFDLIPYKDINIEFIGLRDSEKTKEEIIDYSKLIKTESQNIYKDNINNNITFKEATEFVEELLKEKNIKSKLLSFINKQKTM